MNKLLFFTIFLLMTAGCSDGSITKRPENWVPPKKMSFNPGIQTEGQPAQPAQTAAPVPAANVEKHEEAVEGRTNPFLTEGEEKSFESTKDRLPITNLNLSAIFYSPGASAAIIDGRFYKEGDIVDNKKIIEINREEVILKDAKSVYMLQMKDILGQ